MKGYFVQGTEQEVRKIVLPTKQEVRKIVLPPKQGVMKDVLPPKQRVREVVLPCEHGKKKMYTFIGGDAVTCATLLCIS